MPDGELKIGNLTRDLMGATVEVRKQEAGGPITLTFSASSEAPVERWFGTEVLSHDKGAVRMNRMNGGAAPLLFNHDWGDPIGMIDNARVEDKRLVVDAHLFDTERAREVAKMVDGGLRNISIGYQIHVVEERKKDETYTATDWEPMEVSIVTVPADPSIGIGRSDDDKAKPVRLVRADPNPTAGTAEPKGAMMTTTVETPAAGAAAEDARKKSAYQIEEERKQSIVNLCKANRLDKNFERHWIESGASLNEVADEMLKVMEERGNTKPQSLADIGMTDREVERYSWFRALRVLAAEKGEEEQARREAGFEIEASRAVAKRLGRQPSGIFVPADVQRGTMAQRDMAANPGAKGGFLVAADNLGFIPLLRNRTVLYAMGATALPGLEGQVTIPRQTGAATAGWQNTESSGVSATDQTLGQLSMSPRNLIARTNISRQLMMQSSPAAEAMIRADLAAVIGIEIDRAGIAGAGGAQPIGIINTSGITTGITGTTLGYSGALTFQTSVASANALFQSETSGYITTPTLAGALMGRQRFTSTDTPLWDGNILDGKMAGYRAMSSLQVPASNMLFGDFSKVVIGEWGVLELALNPYQNFDAALFGLRAIYTVDVLVRYPQAFALSTNMS